MAQKSFVKGAAILGVAGILVKVMGALLILPLAYMIGATGMADYTPAYNIYTFFIVIATSGIPVTISRMVSERVTIQDYEEAHRVFRISSYLMIGIGVVSFAIMFFGAQAIADMSAVPESALAMRAVAPALLFVPVMASYRGYFQGQQNMKPTAFSQVVEQIFRVGFGLTLAYTLFHAAEGSGFLGSFSAEEKGAGGAAFGTTMGAFGGFLVMLLIYTASRKAINARRRRSIQGEYVSSGEILKKVLIIAVPITIGACVMPIINYLDAPLVITRLTGTGWSHAVAKNMYGQIGGYCTPLINFPQTLTMALSVSLVPLISSTFKSKDVEGLRYNTSLSMRVAMIIGMPCAVGMCVLAEPILLLLYSNHASEAINVAPTFAILAISVIFLSIVQTVSGVLQGIGKQLIPVRNLCIGVVIKVSVTWICVGIHVLNLKGAAIGTLATYAVVAVLDVIATKKYTGAKFDVMLTYIRPGIATAVMGAVAWFVYYVAFGGGQGNKIGCLAAVLAAGIVYVIMLFVTRSIGRKDLENFPRARRLIVLMDRLGIK